MMTEHQAGAADLRGQHRAFQHRGGLARTDIPHRGGGRQIPHRCEQRSPYRGGIYKTPRLPPIAVDIHRPATRELVERAGGEIVQDTHLVATPTQGGAEVRANEIAAASDKIGWHLS